MAYKVFITSYAMKQLERYIEYTVHELKNKYAAREIISDAERTKKRLEIVANNLPLCENEMLARYGYRKIFLKKHRFFMVYRIDNGSVIVEAMYHELQDYEAIFSNKMNLK